MNEFYWIAIPLMVGFLLDLAIGDPIYLPHPIRWYGWAISYFEKRLNKGGKLILKGAMSTIVLVLLSYFMGLGLERLISVSDYLYYPLASIMVFYGLANRNLIEEALKVEKKLDREGLEAGRTQLSFIVGRDTRQLSEHKIRVAVLETLSENLSDGVVAPLFYYALGGFPLMLCYKMINTLDSMIGYKNERYLKFGRFAARLDDVFNYIPARITAFLMVLISLKPKVIFFVLKNASKHASPNAGYPESALVGILDCRFGGPNVYHGTLVDKPYIGNNDRNITSKDLKKACWINFKVASLTVLLILGIYFIS